MSSPAVNGPAGETVGPFQLVLLVLSVLALLAIAADAFVPLPAEISRILQGVDLIACAAFFLDFVVRFRRAESKLAFMKWGWIDLLASIPNIDLLRLGRFARLLRVIRVLRGARSIQRLLQLMFAQRARGGVASVAVVMFLIVIASSIGILLCERGDGANIKTAGDAVWWSVTTITTVGYGDRYPVTTGGRAIAIGLMVAGVGLFGTLSGIIASVFLGKTGEETALASEVRLLREELARRRSDPAAAEALSSTPEGERRAGSGR